MKITSIHANSGEEGEVYVSVNVLLAAETIPQAIGTVTALLAGLTGQDVPMEGAQGPNVPSVFGQAAATSEQTEAGQKAAPQQAEGSRRRRSSAPADVAPPADAPPAGETQSRRRRTAAPTPSPDPMPINDAEMSKAASNAAEALVALGDDGPELVMLVLKDYGVTSAGDIPQEKRKDFIAELLKEVEAAKAERAQG